MSDIATINIDKATIQSIVEKKMHAAIVSELDGAKNLIFERIIDDLIKSKVDSNGRLTKNSYDTTTLIEYLSKEKIKQVAEQALNKFFNNKSAELEKEVLKVLMKQKNVFAKAAVDAMIKSVNSDFKYRFIMQVEEVPKY